MRSDSQRAGATGGWWRRKEAGMSETYKRSKASSRQTPLRSAFIDKPVYHSSIAGFVTEKALLVIGFGVALGQFGQCGLKIEIQALITAYWLRFRILRG
mmetsp:Transcript_68653/g.138054  ORF Transcript_68653/g.138054 Transcript_68653/m.138054 type:complete len:99 (+) Transcript_68653:402-698(+)